MTRISFEHHYDAALGMFVFTSPEVKGFRATGKTLEEAQRAALAVMDLIQTHRSEGGIIKTVEYAAA